MSEGAARDRQRRDRAHVQVVPPAPRHAAVGELAGLDLQTGRHPLVARRHESHLVVPEQAVVQPQMAALETDAGAIAVVDARTYEIDVADVEVAVADHPDRLALGITAVREQPRSTADATDREPPLRPDGHIAVVVAGHDLDHVTVARAARSVGDARQGLLGPDAPDPGAGRPRPG